VWAASPASLGVGAEEPFRIAFVLLAALPIVPTIEAQRLPRTARHAVIGRT